MFAEQINKWAQKYHYSYCRFLSQRLTTLFLKGFTSEHQVSPGNHTQPHSSSPLETHALSPGCLGCQPASFSFFFFVLVFFLNVLLWKLGNAPELSELWIHLSLSWAAGGRAVPNKAAGTRVSQAKEPVLLGQSPSLTVDGWNALLPAISSSYPKILLR